VPIDASLVPPEETLRLRDLYRNEMRCQIVLDSWHGRGWTDSYLLRVDGHVAGYGLVGGVRAERKEIITEFFVLPSHRGSALLLFRRFIQVSRAKSIEVQTNDMLLTLMLYDCAERIESSVILFHDSVTTNLSVPSVVFRRIVEGDRERIVSQGLDAGAEWMLEADGIAAATGGLLFHYNVPYGDIFMAVAEPLRRRGFGSYLVQELKRVCYESGRIPAARCGVSNVASRATLHKAGMLPCARVLTGVIPA
jgi:GNAT superfamily N-acetyltransferase